MPDDVRDALADEARRQGRSVQAYLLTLVEREARLLRNASVFDRTRSLRVALSAETDPVTIIREGRDSGFAVDRDTTP